MVMDMDMGTDTVIYFLSYENDNLQVNSISNIIIMQDIILHTTLMDTLTLYTHMVTMDMDMAITVMDMVDTDTMVNFRLL